jgi:peptidoglycan/LPS O-acetylase OafA/YrhL
MTSSLPQAPRKPAGTRPYFTELDGIRALAALMIMLFHYVQELNTGGPVTLLQTGVDLFFVLSGFLITTILLQARPGDWHEVRNFYIRRSLRIFPLYYAVLIAVVLFGGAVSPPFWVYLQNLWIALAEPLKLTYPAGPNHFWSLAVEEQFYLVWPFLILFLPRRWLAGVMWAGVVVPLVLRALLVHTSVDLFYFTFTRLDGLAAGALLAFYYHRGTLGRVRGLLWALGAICLLSLLSERLISHGSGAGWVQIVKYTSAAGFYTAVIGLLITQADSAVHRCLRSRPMREVGRVSYGLYVYHPFVFLFAAHHLAAWNLLARTVFCFGGSFALAIASFHAFESPITNLKKRFAKEKPFQPVDASDPQLAGR